MRLSHNSKLSTVEKHVLRMGRPPAGGVPVFRFLLKEVAAMEKALEDTKGATPAREVVQALAEMFSASPERAGKISVQWKQVWNWFQNRRHAVKKGSKTTEKQVSDTTHDVSISKRVSTTSAAVPSGGKETELVKMEFEAKSSRDNAWYDVHSFLAHRMLDSGDPEVRVRFAGFGPEEDEWVNVRSAVRQRSLPCEAAECVAVLPGDLILCFQEGNDQALYYDAYIKEVERRRHDVRGCRCRFLVQYEHDGVMEIVPLRKVCRRPETDRRLSSKYSDSVGEPEPVVDQELLTFAPKGNTLSTDSDGPSEGNALRVDSEHPQSENYVPSATADSIVSLKLGLGGSKAEANQSVNVKKQSPRNGQVPESS